MATITLVFKGGAVTDIDVEKLSVLRSQQNGVRVIDVRDGKDHVMLIDPDEIAAVIERKK